MPFLPGKERALQQNHVRGVGAIGQHPLQVLFFLHHVDNPCVPTNGSCQDRMAQMKAPTVDDSDFASLTLQIIYPQTCSIWVNTTTSRLELKSCKAPVPPEDYREGMENKRAQAVYSGGLVH